MDIEGQKFCVSDRELYGDWLAQQCVAAPGKFVTCGDAFASWTAFAAENGQFTAGSKQAFGQAMRRNRLRVSVRRAAGITFKVYNDLSFVSNEEPAAQDRRVTDRNQSSCYTPYARAHIYGDIHFYGYNRLPVTLADGQAA